MLTWILMRLPMGSSFGQKRRAASSVMIATGAPRRAERAAA